MRPTALMLLAALAAPAGAVPLCLSRLTLADNSAVARAQAIVTRVFASAGLSVEWLSPRQCRTVPVGALRIVLDATVPSRFGPESLGYSLPYAASSDIHIFYDRIRQGHPTDYSILLGHVMAHEICHVLEGIERHSSAGLMRPMWTAGDYMEMHHGTLLLDPEDIQLIDLNLPRRARAILTARF